MKHAFLNKISIIYTMKTSSFLSLGLIFLITLPVFVFLLKIPILHLPSSSEWIFVLLSTLAQAGLSTCLSIFLGILGALGLCAFSSSGEVKQPLGEVKQPLGHVKLSLRFLPFLGQAKIKFLGGGKLNIVSGLEFFCLLPALLPPLVTVLSYINVSEWFFRFPFSWGTVLCVHVLMNTGLSAVFLSRLLNQQTKLFSTYSFLHGVTRWFLLKKLLFFELRKDIILLFVLVFSFCWTSFSVPLLVGSTSGQTIEVFIAEKLKSPTTWPEAMTLFALETAVLFIFFFFLYGKTRPKVEKTENPNQKLYLLPYWPFVFLPLFPAFLILLGLLGPAFFVFQKSIWLDIWLIKGPIILAWAQSLLLGLGAGLTTFVWLCSIAFCLQDCFLGRFLLAYTGSSTAFMGFAFLLLGAESFIVTLLKWILGLSLLFLPAIYRLGGEVVLTRLRKQAEVAKIMGASSWLCFSRLIYPQCQKSFWFLSGVVSVWAIGDFAFSGIVAGDQGHLALLIQDLFSSYRLELATLLTWLLIVNGTVCFFGLNFIGRR